MEDLPNSETPKAIHSVFDTFLELLSSYGWHVIFFLVVANLIYTHFKPKLKKWRDDRHDRQQAAEYQQNPERLIAMQESMTRARSRMQEEHNRLAQERLEKQKQIEEQKRQEKIKKWQCVQDGSSFSSESKSSESVTSDSSKSHKDKSTGSKLRNNDYNPLTGSDSGACYRPSRRFGGSAGG